MTTINLLPWREALREERKREFLVLLFGVVIIAAGIIFLVNRFYSGEIAHQEARNAYISAEIAILDDKVAEINQLRQQRQQISARMDVIQDLQGSRPVIVRIFDELVKTLPSGVYFTSLERTGERLRIEGVAESNNKVSELMRRLDESTWFTSPGLQQITAVDGQRRPDQAGGANAFLLTLALRMPRSQEE